MKIETRQQLLAVLSNNETGLTTAEVAQQIDLSRSATSLYLNELLQEGLSNRPARSPSIGCPPALPPRLLMTSSKPLSAVKAAPGKPSKNVSPL